MSNDCLDGDKYSVYDPALDFVTFKNEDVVFLDCDLHKGDVYSSSTLIKDNKMWIYYNGKVKYPGIYNYINTGLDCNTIMIINDLSSYVRP